MIEQEIDIAARISVMNRHQNDVAYLQLRSIGDFTEGAKWAIRMLKEEGIYSEKRLNPTYLNYKTLENNGWKKDTAGWYYLPTGRSNLYIRRIREK